MKKINFPTPTITEVLVKEIEVLKQCKQAQQRIAAQHTAHLERLEDLYKAPVCVDIAAMTEEHKRIQQTLKRGMAIPQWLAYMVLGLFAALTMSLVANYCQYTRCAGMRKQICLLEEGQQQAVHKR